MQESCCLRMEEETKKAKIISIFLLCNREVHIVRFLSKNYLNVNGNKNKLLTAKNKIK